MQTILDLQKLDGPVMNETALGSSCTSSTSHCCNNQQQSDS